MSDHTLQKAQVLAYLKSHTFIDTWMCARKFNHFKLSTVIGELKRDGHMIDDHYYTPEVGKPHKRYWLVKAARKAA